MLWLNNRRASNGIRLKSHSAVGLRAASLDSVSAKVPLAASEPQFFRIEIFRWRGLAIVLALCGLMAGICTVLTPTGQTLSTARVVSR
jgi:hypothetical protein